MHPDRTSAIDASSPAAKPLNSYPDRLLLHNEVHARPPEAMKAPLAISHLVMICTAAEREASRTHLAELLRANHLPQPNDESSHVREDLPGFRVRWEMHTEFVTWTFSTPIDIVSAPAQAPTAMEILPPWWVAKLPGLMLSCLHVWIAGPNLTDRPELICELLKKESLVGSHVSKGRAQVFTDFALHNDGFARMLVHVRKADAYDEPQRWLGRLVQQLIELDTYRMAALMGLTPARRAFSTLAEAELQLAELTVAIRAAGRDQEPRLLDKLTHLAATVEGHYVNTHARFSASAAYFELVDRRLGEIGDQPVRGLQSLGEFIDRRLSPARATCEWAARRQDALSQRVSRISNLLRTRVEIEQQQSSRELLSRMTRRQEMQLHLQTTVEGLSVAAITYYIAGLLGYVSKAGAKLGWPFSPELTVGVSIPAIALGVWGFIHSMHRRVRALQS